jgi:peptidoglycan/LPS O-acetylase OafA/YrhL
MLGLLSASFYLAAAVVLYMTREVAPEAWHDPTAINRWYLAWSIPVAAYLAFSIAVPRARLRPLREVVRVDGQPVPEVEAVGVGAIRSHS